MTFNSSYAYDREGKYQNKVFCPQHFGNMDKANRIPKTNPYLIEKIRGTEFTSSPTPDTTDDNDKLLNRGEL